MGGQVNASLSGDLPWCDCSRLVIRMMSGWDAPTPIISTFVAASAGGSGCQIATTSERLKVKEEFLAWRNPGRLSFCNVGRDYGDLSLLITCCNRYCRANRFPAVWPVVFMELNF